MPLRLLGMFLLVWEPLRVAQELAASLGSIGMRGPLAVVELLAHAAVAALGAAAGLALLDLRPHAPALARVAITASAAVSVQSLYWSVLPGQTMPGDRKVLAALAVAHAASWMIYLWKSRRVRAITS